MFVWTMWRGTTSIPQEQMQLVFVVSVQLQTGHLALSFQWIELAPCDWCSSEHSLFFFVVCLNKSDTSALDVCMIVACLWFCRMWAKSASLEIKTNSVWSVCESTWVCALYCLCFVCDFCLCGTSNMKMFVNELMLRGWWRAGVAERRRRVKCFEI